MNKISRILMPSLHYINKCYRPAYLRSLSIYDKPTIIIRSPIVRSSIKCKMSSVFKYINDRQPLFQPIISVSERLFSIGHIIVYKTYTNRQESFTINISRATAIYLEHDKFIFVYYEPTEKADIFEWSTKESANKEFVKLMNEFNKYKGMDLSNDDIM